MVVGLETYTTLYILSRPDSWTFQSRPIHKILMDLLSRPYGIPRFFTSLLGGHYAVSKSVLLGLFRNRLPFKLNTRLKDIPIGSKVLLLAGIGHVPLLTARKDLHVTIGPNFTDRYGIHKEFLSSEQVKSVLVPSPWISNLKDLIDPQIRNKVRVWPAAVEIPSFLRLISCTRDTNRALLYLKQPDSEIAESVKELLTQLGFSFSTLRYGAHPRVSYLAQVARSSILIYLGSWESQGLALQEAWALGVRTLVYKQDWRFTSIEDELHSRQLAKDELAAPYLSTSAGDFWRTIEELESTLLRIRYEPMDFEMNQELPRSHSESSFRLWQLIQSNSKV